MPQLLEKSIVDRKVQSHHDPTPLRHGDATEGPKLSKLARKRSRTNFWQHPPHASPSFLPMHSQNFGGGLSQTCQCLGQPEGSATHNARRQGLEHGDTSASFSAAKAGYSQKNLMNLVSVAGSLLHTLCQLRCDSPAAGFPNKCCR